MPDKKKAICLIGGIYFGIGYIVDLLRNFFEKNSYQFSELWGLGASLASTSLFCAFIILFFMILFGKRIYFLQKFIDKFPKLSVYFYYIGFMGYVLLGLDLLVLVPTEFVSLNETVQKYIAWSLAGINIAGLLTALILASRHVFFNKKI